MGETGQGESRAQEQAYISSGVAIIRDDSYDADNPDQLGVEDTEKGSQSLRVTFVDKYVDEDGLTRPKLLFQDKREGMALIFEPRNYIPRVHNKPRNQMTPEDIKKRRAARAKAAEKAAKKGKKEKKEGEDTRQYHPDDRVAAIRLIIDDKHTFETDFSRSTRVLRECDFYMGDLHDIWRVRAIPAGSEVEEDGFTSAKIEKRGISTTAIGGAKTLKEKFAEQKAKKDRGPRTVLDGGPDADDAVMRLMWSINSKKGGEGGWMTTAAERGMGRADVKRDHDSIAPPLYIGQIGDIVIFTPDDVSLVTRDGDGYTIANIRHDAHHHKTAGLDGRIHFEGLPFRWTEPLYNVEWIKSKIVNEPLFKNQESLLGKESGQWMVETPFPVNAIDTWPGECTSKSLWTPVKRVPNPNYDGTSVGKNPMAEVGQRPMPDVVEYGGRGTCGRIPPKDTLKYDPIEPINKDNSNNPAAASSMSLGYTAGSFGVAPIIDFEYFVHNELLVDKAAVFRAFYRITDQDEEVPLYCDFTGGPGPVAGSALVGYIDVKLTVPASVDLSKKHRASVPLLGYTVLATGSVPTTHGKIFANMEVVLERIYDVEDTWEDSIYVAPQLRQTSVPEVVGVTGASLTPGAIVT